MTETSFEQAIEKVRMARLASESLVMVGSSDGVAYIVPANVLDTILSCARFLTAYSRTELFRTVHAHCVRMQQTFHFSKE